MKLQEKESFMMYIVESGDVVWPFAIFSKGNEAFVAENYASAIDLYTAALGIDPLFADCLVAR